MRSSTGQANAANVAVPYQTCHRFASIQKHPSVAVTRQQTRRRRPGLRPDRHLAARSHSTRIADFVVAEYS